MRSARNGAHRETRKAHGGFVAERERALAVHARYRGSATRRRDGAAMLELGFQVTAATSSAELGISSLPSGFVCGSGTLRYAFGRQRGIRCDVSVQFGSLFTVHVKSRLCMLAGISIAHNSGRCAPSTSSVSALRSTAVQNGESAGVNDSEL